MIQEEEEGYRKSDICRFCENNIETDKYRDYCHLTRKYRGPAHIQCNIKVTQKQSNFIPFVFHEFSKYDCYLFFKHLVDKKNHKVKFKIILQTNVEYFSLRLGCIKIEDSYQFLSSGLESLVKTLVDNSHKTLKEFEEENVFNDEL